MLAGLPDSGRQSLPLEARRFHSPEFSRHTLLLLSASLESQQRDFHKDHAYFNL
jgi:hypothetical protein